MLVLVLRAEFGAASGQQRQLRRRRWEPATLPGVREGGTLIVSGKLVARMSMPGSLIDGHAHSQFSWDGSDGCMLESCRRAAETELGGIAFTEHAELTEWVLPEGAAIIPGSERYLDDRTLKLPPLDVERYLRSVEECRRLHLG